MPGLVEISINVDLVTEAVPGGKSCVSNLTNHTYHRPYSKFDNFQSTIRNSSTSRFCVGARIRSITVA